MNICILDLSYWPPEYMSGQPRFGEVIAAWARRALPDANFNIHDIVEGDPFPNVTDYDGYIVSGSDKGVYDKPEWMADLRHFLKVARQVQKPLFGICFGHQIMADVFGGKAIKVSLPEVGVREFCTDQDRFPAHVWHQDQVIAVPPGANVIASADYCPIAGLSYDFPALSVQFHPEYPAEFIMSFIKRSDGNVLEDDLSEKALEELSNSIVSPDLFTTQLGDFFERHVHEPHIHGTNV